MAIRSKIILIVIPLIVAPLLLTGFVSSLSARNGITAVMTEFLRFKAEELVNYGSTQWSLLAENELADDPKLVEASKRAVASFAKSLIRRDTELILAFDRDANIVMSTREVKVSEPEKKLLARLINERSEGWQRVRLEARERVAQAILLLPFDWYVMVTELHDTFFNTINQMYWQIGYILVPSLVVSIALLLGFAFLLTRPLRDVILAMRNIISTNDLSKQVEIIFEDETGELGHTFNLMTSDLDKAYNQIKRYAIRAAVAQTKELRIRNIFQKYVPKEVIEQYFMNPESMLLGENRLLAVMFSDVRSFTAISENMRPQDIVDSLNVFFASMVDIIMDHQGIVDKYIGDSLMAFFGAPVHHDDDAYQAVLSGFGMLDALGAFNTWQREKGRPEWQIGIGINYGTVTVGNIGSERKMDYTVVGDMVNIASRLESLTKLYREPFIISQYVYYSVGSDLPCRQLDRVILKGRKRSLGIYTPRRELNAMEKQAWKLHDEGLKFYYDREFDRCIPYFQKVLELLPGDVCAQMYIDRCTAYRGITLPEDWDGSVVMSEK